MKFSIYLNRRVFVMDTKFLRVDSEESGSIVQMRRLI